MEALGHILLWFFFIIFFIDFLLILFWAFTFLKNKTPFIPTPLSVLPDIEKALNLKEGSVLFDLGSGDSRVVRYFARKNKNIKIVGIENNPFPLLLSKISIFFTRREDKQNLKIVKNNFFDEDLSSVTHIFSYIYPNEMDDLLPKFDKEFKGPVRMVSLNYRFTNKQPIFEVDLVRGKHRFSRRLYVYEF